MTLDSIYTQKHTVARRSAFDSIHAEAQMLDDTLLYKSDSLAHDTLRQSVPVIDYEKDEKARHDGTKIPFALEHTDGVFALLLLCFIFFSRIGGLGFLRENAKLLLSFDKSKRFHKEGNIKEMFFTYFLILQTFILSAIIAYAVFIELEITHPDSMSPLFTIFSFIVAIILFYIIKFLFYRLLGYIFNMRDELKTWLRTNIVVIEILGILLFIPTILLVYGNYWHPQIIIYALVLFAVAQIILFYRTAVFFVREKFNFLFLIVYLCSIEIIPYLFLASTLTFLYGTDVFNIL